MRYLLVLFTLTLMLGKTSAQTSNFTDQPSAVAVVVTDLAASMAFYTEVIGFQRKGGFPIDETFARRSGLSQGVGFEVVLLTTDTSRSGLDLKLVEFAEAPVRSPGEGVQARAGLQYMTLFVKDLSPVLQRMAERGIASENEPTFALGDGRRFLLVRDPDGVYVEMIEAGR